MINIGIRRRRQHIRTDIPGFLTGARGAWFNGKNNGEMFQLSGGTTAVAAPADPVGYWIGSGGNLGSMTVIQATAGLRPTWQTSNVDFDGAAQYLDFGTNMLTLMQAASAITVVCRLRTDSIASANRFFAISNGTGTQTVRFQITIQTTGQITLAARRLDADASNTTINGGLAKVGVDTIIGATIDYAGTGAMALYQDGALVASGTMGGALGAVENTASLRARLGCDLGTTPGQFLNGPVYQMVAAAKLATAAEIRGIGNSMLAA